MFKVSSKNNNVIDVVFVFLLLTLKISQHFSTISIVDFEQINLSWVQFEFLFMLMCRFTENAINHLKLT